MIGFTGRVWRILTDGPDLDPTGPARSPEGRFHHGGQIAVYTSLSEEGAAAALDRYLAPGDAPRVLIPLAVAAERVADLRDGPAEASAKWQDARALGRLAPTWALSDAARTGDAQGMLYRSRSRPDLCHFVAFTSAVLSTDGQPRRWTP